MNLNLTDSSLKKTYIYVAYSLGRTYSQIFAQHNGDNTAPRFFYLHDRLGSVRLVIDNSDSVAKYYAYEPLGQVFEATDHKRRPTVLCSPANTSS